MLHETPISDDICNRKQKYVTSQTAFSLSAKCRGCHLVTHEILQHLPGPLPKTGMLNLFVLHTSCALSINDMPAHAKCSLLGVSLTVPITNGRLNLGTWQGIYLCEFRNYGDPEP